MIAFHAFFKGHKCTFTYGNLLSTFKDGRPFIYFIKHSHVDHFSTRPNGSHQLRPKERTFIAGNKRIMIFPLQISPWETGEDQRSIIYLILLCPLNIFFHQFLILGISRFIITPYKPRHHDITFSDKLMQAGIWFCVPIQCTPLRRYSKHHTESLWLQAVNNMSGFFQPIATIIIKSDSPNRNQRFTIVIQIRGVLCMVF